MKSPRWCFALVCALGLAGIALAGCGSGGGSSSSEGTTSTAESASTTETASGGGSEGVQQAKEFVESHSDLSKMVYPKPPMEPYDVGKGKMAVITCSTAGAGCLALGKEVEQAVTASGWSQSELGNGEFNPAVQANLIQQAVQEKVDGIVLVSIDLASVEGAVEQAIAAGIPMSCVSCAADPNFPSSGGKVPMTTPTGKPLGEAIGNYVVSESGGKGSILAFDNVEFPINKELSAGFSNTVEKLCPACEIKHEIIAGEELAKPGPPVFTAALAANPEGSVEWVFADYGTFIAPMVKTAEQQGREFKMVTAGGEPVFTELMGSSPNAVADVFVPYGYMSWAGVDEVLRNAAGLKAWKADTLPSSILTVENVGPVAEAAPGFYEPPGFDFKSMFEKLWGGSA